MSRHAMDMYEEGISAIMTPVCRPTSVAQCDAAYWQGTRRPPPGTWRGAFVVVARRRTLASERHAADPAVSAWAPTRAAGMELSPHVVLRDDDTSPASGVGGRLRDVQNGRPSTQRPSVRRKDETLPRVRRFRAKGQKRALQQAQ